MKVIIVVNWQKKPFLSAYSTKLKNFRIKPERFIQLAKETAVFFHDPNLTIQETEVKFYYPYKKSKATNQTVSAGGWFHNRYNHLKQEYRDSGLIKKKGRSGKR